MVKLFHTFRYLSILFFVMFPILSANAAGNEKIAFLNLTAAMVFHPEMAKYDPFKKCFRKSFKAQGKPVQSAEKLEQIRELKNQDSQIEKQLSQLRATFNVNTNNLKDESEKRLAKLATATAAVEKNKNLIRLDELSKKFHAEFKSFLTQQQQIAQKIKEIERSSWEEHTNYQETEAKLLEIMEEIKLTAANIASKKGIEVIVNSSNFGLKAAIEEDAFSTTLEGNSISKLYEGKNDIPEAIALDAASMEGSLSMQSSNSDIWLQNRDYLLSPIAQQLSNSMELSGGINITSEVVKSLLDKYQVSSDAVTTVMKSLKKIEPGVPAAKGKLRK
ncbi:MAG: hypothetical protein HQM10_14690 [Candidatus Riflebacteria bacterium]|nr:hypothetical protein [Candidatus Riflebacteria bacterium]